jgi:sulfide:quinone oxidoreductase
MTLNEITPDYSVAPQIGVDDVADIASRGFRTIMCNRPDGEAPDQPDADVIRAEVERQGLTFAFLPVISGQIQPEDVARFRDLIAELPGPVLAYCRSGMRCHNLWVLAQR